MVTIIDVSKRARVSVSTVSRVINGTAGVRAEPKERVLEAIRELGFRPSYSARLLKTQKSYSIFILVPEINNPYFTDIYHGARIALEGHGYMAFLFEASNPVEVCQAIVNRGADGVILDARYADSAGDILKAAGIPYTVFNTPAQFDLPNSIRINLYETLIKLCSELYSLGHENIGFISDRPVDEHPHDRLFAFKKAAELSGRIFNPDLLIREETLENQFACGYRGFKRLLKNYPDVDAVIAINDLAAIGAMLAAREIGLDVPGSISVAGFDNSPAGQYSNPPLTTVNLPSGKQGELAAEMLLKTIDEPDTETYSITLDTEILFRKSVRGGSPRT